MTDFSQTTDFSKMNCRLHLGQTINNFCAFDTCRTPLCPTCVCQHTQMHQRAHTQPKYENIRTTFERLHQLVQSQITTIIQDKDRLNRLFGAIRVKKSSFRDTIKQAREECVRSVGEHFDELEKRWESDMVNEERKNGLHSSYRLETLYELIGREADRLIDQSRRMNGMGFIQEAERLEREVLVESNQFHARVVAQLEDNEHYRPVVSYLKQNLGQLKGALNRIMSLDFTMPVQRLLGENKNISGLCSNWKQKDIEGKKSETPIKYQPYYRESFNVSTVVKRLSTQKPIILQQSMSQSMFVGVPKVLTTSFLQSGQPSKPQSIMPNYSEVDKRASKINFSPHYIDGVDLTKFSRPNVIEMGKSLKPKKAGLSLMTSGHGEVDALTSDKENSR